MSFGNYVTAECVARGFAGRLLQIIQAVASFPDGCFQYAATIAKGLPVGRQGKPAHLQTIYRAFREHPELFERKRIKPGGFAPGGDRRQLSKGGGITRVRLDFLGLKKPRFEPTPRRAFNVNRPGVAGSVAPATPIRLRHAVIETPAPVAVDPEMAALVARARSYGEAPQQQARATSAPNSGRPDDRPPD